MSTQSFREEVHAPLLVYYQRARVFDELYLYFWFQASRAFRADIVSPFRIFGRRARSLYRTCDTALVAFGDRLLNQGGDAIHTARTFTLFPRIHALTQAVFGEDHASLEYEVRLDAPSRHENAPLCLPQGLLFFTSLAMVTCGLLFSVTPVAFVGGLLFLLFQLTTLWKILRWDPAAGLVIIYATAFWACVCGIPFSAVFGPLVLAPLSEETGKRAIFRLVGWAGVWFFALSEAVLYVHFFGWTILPLRLILATFHVFWTNRPFREGVVLHWTWNAFVTLLSFVGGPADFAALFWQHYQLSEVHTNLLVFISFVVVSICLFAMLGFCSAYAEAAASRSARHESGDVISASHYRVVGSTLYYVGEGRCLVVNVWPKLFRFREWERLRTSHEGFVDLWTLSPHKTVSLRLYYLWCVRAMQGQPVEMGKVRNLLERLLLTNSQLGGDREMAARRHNRLMHALNGNIDEAALVELVSAHVEGLRLDDNVKLKIISVLIRVAALGFRHSTMTDWAVAFTSELIEFAPWLAAQVLDAAKRVPESHFAKLKAWFTTCDEDAVHQSPTIFEFLTSEFFMVFVRALGALVFVLVTGRKVGWLNMLGDVRVWVSFASFLRDLASMLKTAYDRWVSQQSLGASSFFFAKSFHTLEAEIDLLLAQPLPGQESPTFIQDRDELVDGLTARLDALVHMSAHKPELSARVASLARRIEEARTMVYTHQYGIRPVVLMLVGPAGVSKSSFATALAAQFLTQGKHLAPEQRPEHATYIYRASGTKHLDALNNPKAVRVFIFDDFGQCQQEDRQIMEAALFHSLVSEVKVPLPYASLPLKAQATDLQPRLIILCTNTLGFPAAESFDKGSMVRRVDLCVQMDMADPRTPPFSAVNKPGRYSVRFLAGTLYYGENSDPVLKVDPKPLVVKGTHAKGVSESDAFGATTDYLAETDRVVVQHRLSSFAIARAAANKESYEERMHGRRCHVTGLGKADHFGVRCGPECAFTDLEGELPGTAQSLSSVAVGVLLSVTLRYAWESWGPTRWRGYIASIFFTFCLLPFACTYAHHWVTSQAGLASALAEARLADWRREWRDTGFLRTAFKWRVVRQARDMQARVTAVCALLVLLAGSWFLVAKFRKGSAAAIQSGPVPLRDNEIVKEYSDARRKLPMIVRRRANVSGKLEDVKSVVLACLFDVYRSGKTVGRAVSNRASMALPAHMVEGAGCLTFRSVVGSGVGQYHDSTWISGQNTLVSIPGSDVAVLNVSGPPRRDIAAHCENHDVLRQLVGPAYAFVGDAWLEVVVSPLAGYYVGEDQYAQGFRIVYPEGFRTHLGLCGAPVVAPLAGGLGLFLGFHHAGQEASNVGYGQYVSRSDWAYSDGGLARLPTPPLNLASVVVYQSLNMDSLGDLEGRSTRYVRGPLTFLGNDPSYVPSKVKSSISVSRMSVLFPEGGPEVFGVPDFVDRYDPSTGSATGPLAAFGQFPKTMIDVDPTALAKARADLELDADYLSSQLAGMTPLSLKQAINGVPGAINPIDMSTSAGPGLHGQKRDHFEGEVGDLRPKDYLWKQCCDVLESDDPYVLAKAFGKDEVRERSKLTMPRTVFCLTTSFLILARVFFSVVLYVLRCNPWVSECAVGINAAGKAWTVIGEKLDEVAPHGKRYRLINTDFSKYDRSQRAWIREIAYYYLFLLISRTAYTTQQLQVTFHLLKCCLSVMLNLMGEWFYTTDFQPSGDPITVEINSITQRLIFRYWFYRCMPDASVGDFKNWVWLVTYGDDGLARVVEHACLTQFTLQRCCAELGFAVTSADKGELRDYADRESVTFLKRSFVYDREFDGYRAPLVDTSIYKMLCWFDSSSAINEAVWSKQVLENANAEWFLHGRERFNRERARLEAAARLVGVEPDFKTFDSLMASYRDTTFTTWSMSLPVASIIG